ncbi:hypothetical protein ACTTAF_06690 [Rhodobacter capsulatus]|uniref:hypothetical protein n=1 Tax=Rhodobacter capsulatus TaxID=1061 RepID=UPI00103A534D|nr:hypothetical protein [Rhodobacter capsulatus]
MSNNTDPDIVRWDAKNSHGRKENATSAKSLNKREEDVGNVVGISRHRQMNGNDFNDLHANMAEAVCLRQFPELHLSFKNQRTTRPQRSE